MAVAEKTGIRKDPVYRDAPRLNIYTCEPIGGIYILSGGDRYPPNTHGNGEGSSKEVITGDVLDTSVVTEPLRRLEATNDG